MCVRADDASVLVVVLPQLMIACACDVLCVCSGLPLRTSPPGAPLLALLPVALPLASSYQRLPRVPGPPTLFPSPRTHALLTSMQTFLQTSGPTALLSSSPSKSSPLVRAQPRTVSQLRSASWARLSAHMVCCRCTTLFARAHSMRRAHLTAALPTPCSRKMMPAS